MIYIQSASGLTPISSPLSKEKIIAALGYTPADQATFYEDESGALIIADETGYIIARIDAEGMTTTKVSANAIELNGEDLAQKLQELVSATPEINTEGLATEEALTAHTTNAEIHVTAENKTAWDAKSDFSGAYTDLIGAPNIINDNEDEVVICDASGNVILRATAEGLNVVALYINGKIAIPAYDDTMEGATLKIVGGTPTWVLPTE